MHQSCHDEPQDPGNATSDGSEAYADLVRARKVCRLCDGLTNPASCADGIYDGDYIGPWSQWQGSLTAVMMIVGQDWGDTAYYIKQRGRDDESNATNKMLVELVRSTGLEMNSVFLTNAILCLKEGGLQAPVREQWFANCGPRFLKPTIELIKPKVLVTLGEWAYRSVQKLYSLPPLPFRKTVDRQEGFQLPHDVLFFPMYHCGRRILNTHRSIEKQMEDWKRIKLALAQVILAPQVVKQKREDLI